ncbi:SpoIIIAH-like family protein [Alkaliphilus peptidifermentans]|uniref:Stage III sporulation protein AH n=1 Tax=Alkaliphilus peptidifermentans DSM 18978 TaxID=1120976 RepID=A0A1G5KDF5_9FIRM|nr:SpoIIIAH-like family protein [Alkaliphilus peptidifermentans]SCY98653.1 stage III sporulation protein AH [Alkaliphilus peptidifermentans DSM 18978]
MKINGIRRKNFVIFSLVLMLGLIGYINYNLNKQSLLQTSSELERYELMMMQESGMLEIILEDDDFVYLEDEESNMVSTTTKDEDDNIIIVDSLGNDPIDVAKETSAQISKIITDKQMMQSNAYFIEGRLERDKKRSEMVSHLDQIINNDYTTVDHRNQAQNLKLSVITNLEKEMLIENMIVAKGFNDVIVYLSENSINIIVQSSGLVEKEVAQIVDIVRRETDISMDNIIIMEKK